jgi:hypothetical protein
MTQGQGPKPRAALRGFIALVLDMVRVDPDRRPSTEVRRWHRELAAKVGVPAEQARTNRELLGAALRLSHSLPDYSAPGDQPEAAPPLEEGSDLPATIAAGSPAATSRKAPIRR